MSSERLLKILALMAERGPSASTSESLCAVAAQMTGVDGAHIALRHNSPSLTAYCASDDVASTLLDLEMTLGEGPATDVCANNEPVLVPDLELEGGTRWVSYPSLAATSHVAAVYSFPIHVGAARLGALTLYRCAPGSLDLDQESDAFFVATVVARTILSSSAGESDQLFLLARDEPSHFDFAIHQAAGMVAVQGNFGVADALVALRAHAFATGEGLVELAARVVAREVRYEALSQRWVKNHDVTELSNE